MIRALALCLVAALAACGVDGPPTAPDPAPERTTGVTVSGSAQAGVIYREQ
ncbi:MULTISPECIES: hypothetical protein [Dinoroseobacter]|uniref:hypothetical protein n=1 Tax=Dinoroseobacter TaxID=309512 RepID=UPI0002D6A407|nr:MULTISPECIES: hypothetical protein [Dinoroseobacter]MDD9716764.1 hypothetical protein [Dinoroseobacter sp. PD6]URF46213.1 hypothetical protein M8008_15750 [Dinoroseobacter shibae]URF50520.1 hypothetical protein M8007_15750 [Dinoroseobacter shibae]